MTESVCSTMNVCSPKPWDTRHGVTRSVLSVYCWRVFCFGFLYKFDVCMIEKKKLLYLLLQTSRIDCFCRVNIILRWNVSSDLKRPCPSLSKDSFPPPKKNFHIIIYSKPARLFSTKLNWHKLSLSNEN